MCYIPIRFKKDDDTFFPCGKCPLCLNRRASGWSFRLLQEGLHAESAYFITLTYDTNYVPITDKGFMSLDKRDLQLFFKRVRKAHGNGKSNIKYYAVGEYGSKRLRPHYHIIIYNLELDLLLTKEDLKMLEYTDYDGKYHIQMSSWGLGTVTFGKVCGASVGYTLKYISKPGKIPMFKGDDRVKEKAYMSKGLGKIYLSEKMIQWHKADLLNRMYLNVSDGKKASMPRYYKDKIYSKEERALISGHYIAENMKKQIDNYDLELQLKHKKAVNAAFERMHHRYNQTAFSI